MVKQVEISILPKYIEDMVHIRTIATKKARLNPEDIVDMQIVRRSIDARGRQPVFRLKIELYEQDSFKPEAAILDQFQSVVDAPKVIVVGAGPAGYFAALELIEQGLKPIVLDRGKDVRMRRRDLRAIQQFGEVNPHSNYCFGEGGAGTYSDGKLYTRSQKRGNIYKALKLLVEHGASLSLIHI